MRSCGRAHQLERESRGCASSAVQRDRPDNRDWWPGGNGISTHSSLQAQLAREIALSGRDPLPTQDGVGRGRVEVKVRLGEREKEILGGEVNVAVAERKAHVTTDESVDLGSLDRLESGERFSDPRLECREIVGGP